MTIASRNNRIGISLALLAVLIWSGNFIVAKDVNKDIPPVALNFYRWLTASIILFPFAIKIFIAEWKIVKSSWQYLFWTALTGVALFNSFVYIGAHYTTAINLALIGTTSSPIMAVIFARIFLKEKIGWMKLAGMLLCIAGVLFLLSKGDLQNLATLRFGKGDLWMLLAAFCFAAYNTLVKKKPIALSPPSFLFAIFSLGTILLLPFFIWEGMHAPVVKWSSELVLSILFLGLGASVICFLIWNKAIGLLGAGRTALFGNLIPVFSSLEAVILLNEKISYVHLISFILVVTGLLIANLKK